MSKIKFKGFTKNNFFSKKKKKLHQILYALKIFIPLKCNLMPTLSLVSYLDFIAISIENGNPSETTILSLKSSLKSFKIWFNLGQL